MLSALSTSGPLSGDLVRAMRTKPTSRARSTTIEGAGRRVHGRPFTHGPRIRGQGARARGMWAGLLYRPSLNDARRRPKRGSQRLLCPCRGWPSVSSVHAGWRDLRRYGDRRHFLQLGEEPKAESEAVSVGALAVEDLARRVIAAQTWDGTVRAFVAAMRRRRRILQQFWQRCEEAGNLPRHEVTSKSTGRSKPRYAR